MTGSKNTMVHFFHRYLLECPLVLDTRDREMRKTHTGPAPMTICPPGSEAFSSPAPRLSTEPREGSKATTTNRTHVYESEKKEASQGDIPFMGIVRGLLSRAGFYSLCALSPTAPSANHTWEPPESPQRSRLFPEP